MKQNKIITAALISALTLSGTYASAFTDMADTEQSIVMERLGIISGYEDGAFKPEQSVTRAEAAKIIVSAIGYNYDFTIEDGDSSFSDVPSSHWAYKYISLASSENVVSGYDDGTFRPDEHISIDQLLTMLVNATGYGTYAEATGGYPNGYRTWAVSVGIADDLKIDNGGYLKAASRLDVLTCTANALEAPVCLITAYDTAWDGRVAPIMEVKDGKGKDFQSLLTYRHDVYIADEVKVTNADKSSIEIKITRSENFADEFADEKNPVTATVKIPDGIDVPRKDGKYKMYIVTEDFDMREFTLLYASEIS